MTTRLLLVEPSATMRYVLETYVQSSGFSVVSIGDYAQAESALHQQFRVYGSDFAAVLLGWPAVPDEEATVLLDLLDSPDFSDLPVVVMATDKRAETRAWVAGREHTAVLPWKEYQGIDALLNRLLDAPGTDGDVFPAKFDNSDIHVLIVDDSVSIRFALRDLFELQGYRVSLAGSQEEAILTARETHFDIAVLDFYLQDSTGDSLCRDLLADPDTGDLTCCVLTGTYADHIIKRSLRAGAVECMFKNESSELLLARIDAIARFVRQRKLLQTERRQLDQLVDTLAGSALIVGADNRIQYATEQALSNLGLDSRRVLMEQPASELLDVSALRALGPGKHRAVWQNADRQAVNVIYRALASTTGDELIVNFRIVAGASALLQLGSANTPAGVVSQLQLRSGSERFVACLSDYLDQSRSSSTEHASDAADQLSLLIIDVFAVRDAQAPVPAHHVDGLADVLETRLLDVYKRADHVCRLSDSRFAFLLRHTNEPQSYLLTRKIMQICNDVRGEGEPVSLSSTGCLVSLQANAEFNAAQLLMRTQQGLDAVNERGVNQALLLDLRRMLPVYPTSETDSSTRD